jgi:hypothetical protein
MVSNTENILVEFDYNNITIIDPNKVIDSDNNTKERFVSQENLVMYANLECSVIPRTKLALGVANNDSIRTVSIAKINFLKPGNKEYLDNSYTDEITGKDSIKGYGVNQPNLKSVSNPNKSDDFYITQTINSGGKPGATDNGLLGISSINIRQGLDFLPTVDIKLTDVKGRAMFEAGDNSPYAAFFNLPYPLFYLTIKGYYGKAVRLALMLQNFTSTYNSSTANFDIDLKFVTYKYTILSDITMAALIATPHMYQSRYTVSEKSGGPSPTSVSKNILVEKGYQKVREMYSEYISKGLIPSDFPQITVAQMRDRIENFITNVLDSFTKQNLDPLTNLDSYQSSLFEYQKEVFYTLTYSWFYKYMDTKNYYVDNRTSRKIYTFKKEYNLQKKSDAISELKGLIDKYKTILDANPTCGVNGSYEINGKKVQCKIPNDISYEKTFSVSLNYSDINIDETYKQQRGNSQPNELDKQKFITELQDNNRFNNIEITLKNGAKQLTSQYFVFEGVNSFIDLIKKMEKDLKTFREQIEDELTKALSNLLESKDSGIGFVPNIRNVLSVIFANGEAFIRLMDDVHTKAWSQRNEPIRKNVVFNKTVSSASADNKESGNDETQPIYPWPQVIKETTGERGQEKFELRYPGDKDIISETKGYLYDVWPEIEFVEEFLFGLTQKTPPVVPPTDNSNTLTETKRVSLNGIEFPISNEVYANKEEVKFFYEIYERFLLNSYYTKLDRCIVSTTDTDIVTNVVAESENINLKESLGREDLSLIKKLKDYKIDSTNFLNILRAISNEGTGPSWQNFIRGIFVTPYIKNIVDNIGFKFIDKNILTESKTQPLVSLNNEDKISTYISKSTSSNSFDFSDIYPFTNKEWVKSNLASGSGIDEKLSFNTTKTLLYNPNQKIISNFSESQGTDEKKPITNFVYKNIVEPNVNNQTDLRNFYASRTYENQLPTEGDIKYLNYSGLVSNYQTTSIFNTPYFVNSIQEGVEKFTNKEEYPFVSSAYLFLNSLPLSTLREKYKSYKTSNGNSSVEELDYIYASLNKFSAVHKTPYPWVLKIGSVWHRYKKQIEEGIDILDGCWNDFDYTLNYDPVNGDKKKKYVVTIPGQVSATTIVLEDFTTASTQNGVSRTTTINTGFYPKLINDFNIFYQGYELFTGYTNNDIQKAFDDGFVLNYVPEAVINRISGNVNGFNTTIKVIPWSVSVNGDYGQFTYIFPSNGSLINQTSRECIDVLTEVGRAFTGFDLGEPFCQFTGNTSMYNGSVRLFWTAPNYGYFDNSRIIKPSSTKYLKEVWSGQTPQENFSINGEQNQYTDISEIFSVFGKTTLDKFENEFLNFSKSVYDYVGEGNDIYTNTELKFKNFQSLMREMMKITRTDVSNTLSVEETQSKQLINITNLISQFLNNDIYFMNGNPSNFDRRLFGSFTNRNKVIDPITWQSYNGTTPDSLPTTNPFSPSYLLSFISNPITWTTLETYVGFSSIPELVYDDDGSYITDFFIDCDVAFTETNIINLWPIIKIYATQKLKDKTLDFNKFKSLMDGYLDSLNNYDSKIIDNTMIKVRKSLPDVVDNTQQTKGSVIESTQTKLELWESFKATNDKWIAGNDFKTKTLFEDILLLDRASRNVGDKILVDILKLKKMLTNINPKTTMLIFVNQILVQNNFVVMNTPSYVNFYNVQDVSKNPTPKPEGSLEFANTLFGTFMNVDYRESSAKMVCFYAGKPSEQLDLKNNIDYRFRNDAFDLRRSSDNPILEDQTNKKDWDKSNKVVGFNVDIGPQNQSIFKGFSVSQNPGLATAESLEVINQMANQSGNRGGSTQSVSLFNLYKNRSYGCSVTMMGNALIQPTMYFNLRYVPMFSGPYMIQKVNHSITPGVFETTFEGIRQPTASLPKVDNYLQSLKTSLLQSIVEKNKKDKADKLKKATTATTKNNVINQKNDVVKDNTKKEGTKPNNSPSCPPVETATKRYEKFVLVTPTETSVTIKNVVEYIMTKTEDQKMRYSVFAKLYLNSNNDVNLKTLANNYSGTKIDVSDWGASVEAYFTKKEYYCGGNLNTKPYVVFENFEQNVDFLMSRYSGRTITINEITPKDITKFITLYSESVTQENVYTTMTPSQLSEIEDKVEKSIKLFNTNSGNLTNKSPQADVPAPDPFDFVVEEVGGSFNKLTVTIKPNVGTWKMFIAEYHYYKVTSECGNSEGSRRRLDEYFSTNKETFTITRQNILDEEGCGPTTPQQDLVGKYTYQIWIYANLDLPVTNVGERSREQAIWNDYVISFEIK